MPAALDGRAGVGRIASRIGISADADTFAAGTDVFSMIEQRLKKGNITCVFIDSATGDVVPINEDMKSAWPELAERKA